MKLFMYAPYGYTRHYLIANKYLLFIEISRNVHSICDKIITFIKYLPLEVKHTFGALYSKPCANCFQE